RVQPAFQQLQQVLARNAALSVSQFVIIAELALEHSIYTAQLLFLAKLDTIIRQSSTLLTMLAGRIISALDCAFVSKTFFTFQKELLSFPAALTTFWVKISCHSPLLKYG